jgi:hypothetical protein
MTTRTGAACARPQRLVFSENHFPRDGGLTQKILSALRPVVVRVSRWRYSIPLLGSAAAIVVGRDVAVSPVDQIRSMIASAGFETPVLFLQTGLIHAWYERAGEGKVES